MDGDGVLTFATSKVQITESDSQRFAEVSPGKYVCISVSDTGKGMSAEECERAFEPFFTTKDVGAGSGLGLSMVQGFAIQSNGSVSISSVQGEKTIGRPINTRWWVLSRMSPPAETSVNS